MSSQYSGTQKKEKKEKELTSTVITLYASVIDNAPGNESRRYRVLGLSVTNRGDTGLIISDLDRWSERSGLMIPSIEYSSSCTSANALASDVGVIPVPEVDNA